MKTLEKLISYSEDSTSAYVYENEVNKFAAENGKNAEIVLEEIEQELWDYILVETEKPIGRIIFHKIEEA